MTCRDTTYKRGFDIDTSAQSQLPLTEATFLILLSLASVPRHGYAIMKDVAALSDGRIVFGTGTLYGALKRLLEQDWIERIATAEAGRGQKQYQLTDLGRRILDAEAQRLDALTAAAHLRLGRSES